MAKEESVYRPFESGHMKRQIGEFLSFLGLLSFFCCCNYSEVGYGVSQGLQVISDRIPRRVTMFPDWTVNRACKFFLERFLGRFIRGVIDLDGLQVQLRVGTIQLNGIALKTDFLNQQFGVTPVIVKEGFIGSISIKIPWKLKMAAFENCEINVDELVLLLVPRTTEERSASEVHSEQVEGATYLDGVQDWVKKMVAQMVERLLLGLHVKIKNLIITFEQGSQICGTNLGGESNCQSQSILTLRVLQTEYVSGHGDGDENASGLHPDNVMLTKFTNFQGATVELYDVKYKVSQPGSLRHFVASLLSGEPGKSPVIVSVPLIHGKEGGFSGSVQLSIPGRSGSMDIPKINAEIRFDPIKLHLQPCTIHRLISLLHSIGERGDKGCEPNLCSNNEQSIGFEHDESIPSLHLSESVTTDVLISSFSNMPSPAREETTLIPDSMIISNWLQNVDLGESDDDEFFDCLDDSTNLPAIPVNSSLWSLPHSVSVFIASACNLNIRLDGVSVVIAFEDHGYANLVSSLERSRDQFLEQETGCLGKEENYLEANFEDLIFSVQGYAKEVRFETMVKHFEIYEYLIDDSGKGTKLSLSNREECSESSMPSIKHIQRAVEDALPRFPLSLYTPEAVDKINNMKNEDEAFLNEAMVDKRLKKKESTSSTFRKFVKIKILASECDSAHHFSLNCLFGNMKCYDFASSCTKFEVQLQPFVLWVDFYAANKLCQLIEGIANLFKIFGKISDEARDGCSSTGRTKAPQGSIQGNVSISCGRVILCFPMEITKDMSPYFMRDNFICIDFSESASAGKCQQKGLLKEDVISLKDSHFPSSSFVNLKMGESALFLVSPSSRTNVKRVSGDLGERHFSARKVFSILKGKKGAYSVFGIQWQDIPGIGMGIVERAREESNEDWTRRTRSRRVNGNNSEFTIAKALKVPGSYLREELIQNSALLIHFLLPHAQLDLYGSEYILVANLLSLLTDCICFKGHKETCLNSEGKLVKESCHPKVSQSLIIFECKVLDIAIHLVEPMNITASMERELRGSWASFRLTVRNVEALSVSNLEGVSGASYLCLNHDEGFLYGSFRDKREQPQSAGAIREFCLLCLKTNVLGRGDGEGTNALATGNAGTTIIHLDNPKYLHTVTTVTIRCATLVAPGGRIDWLGSIISFFNQSSTDEQQITDAAPQARLLKDANYSTSFLLEVLDIAVSYEPFLKAARASSFFTAQASNFYSAGGCVEEARAPVACILAAAAMRFSFKTKPDAVNKKYTIMLEDVGLLLLDSSKGRNHKHGYDAESLQSEGYVKIAGEAIMNLDVEMNCQDNLLWEVNCTKGHICLDTCHDTTAALKRLVAQLQLLFAPDYEEFADHLQMRRDSHHASEATPVGLMEGIVEIAFCSGDLQARLENEEGIDTTLNGLDELVFEEDCDLEGSVSTSVCVVSPTVKEGGPFKPTSSVREEDMKDFPESFPMSQRFESKQLKVGESARPNKSTMAIYQDVLDEKGVCYEGGVSTSVCVIDPTAKERGPSKPASSVEVENMKDFPESFPMSKRFENKQLKVGESARPSKSAMAIDEDALDGKGRWFESSSLRFLENHISNIEITQEKVNGFHGSSGNSSWSGKSIQPVGRVSLNNFRVTWKMYAGSDWPARTNQGEPARNAGSLFEVELHGMNARYDAFPEGGGLYASKLAVSIQDLGILDHSERAPRKRVLRDYHSKKHPRDSTAKALKLEVEAVKPDPSTPLEEYRFVVKLIPLRLHLDQSQLDFFVKFFSQKGSSRELSAGEELLLPFFQKCEIYPLNIYVDYVPRQVNVVALRDGMYSELLNLFSWKGINLHLKGVETGGISGLGSVSEIVVGNWVEDIRQNHLHKLIKGVTPIRPLVALAKLLSLPAGHYRKDRRLLKSLLKEVIASVRASHSKL